MGGYPFRKGLGRLPIGIEVYPNLLRRPGQVENILKKSFRIASTSFLSEDTLKQPCKKNGKAL
jgi:hypothetical protein